MAVNLITSVALGGAVGAVGRYLVMIGVARFAGNAFPWSTLAVNVLGCLILGGLIEVMALVWSPSEEIRAFLAVGMLGAFTTFSTFSLDVFTLFERGQVLAAAAYVGASVVLSLLAFGLGMAVMRQVLT